MSRLSSAIGALRHRASRPNQADATELDSQVEVGPGKRTVMVQGPLGFTAVDVGARTGGAIQVPSVVLHEVSGWSLEERGWCNGAACVPAIAEFDRDAIDLVAAATELGLPVARFDDDELTVVVLGRRTVDLQRDLMGAILPPHSLRDLDGSPATLHDIEGRRLVLFWASWCGCRYELPSWQQLSETLAACDPGVQIVAVALDADRSAVEPWIAELTMPVLLDVDRSLANALGVLNVPTAVWIDEDDRLVRGPEQIFGDNRFIEHHGVDSGAHHEALGRWAEGDEELGHEWDVRWVPTSEQQEARAEFQLACHLLRLGRREAANVAFASAAASAPEDLSLQRAALLLEGDDPFGPRFDDLFGRWSELTGGLSYRSSGQGDDD